MATMEEAVGAGTRAVREQHGITLDQLAREVSSLGLPWTASRAAKWERGTIPATLTTCYLVTGALSALTGSPVHLSDLVGGETVTLADRTDVKTVVSSDSIMGALRGDPVSRPNPLRNAVTVTPADWTDADERAATDLDLDTDDMRGLTAYLYGHSASAERDHRAGEGVSPQKRGRVMREVLAELREALPRWRQHVTDTEAY